MIETKDRQLDALAILNAIPGCYLVLLPDTPRFTIVAATDAYLDITRTSREELIGLGVFEAFSSDTDEHQKNSLSNLRTSLNHVLEHKKEDRMPRQGYGTVSPVTGHHEERVWNSINKPVFNRDGKIEYIIHWVENVSGESEVKESSIEIEQQKKFISSILDASFNGIYSLEAIRNPVGEITDFRYLFVNEHISKNLGLSPGEVVGKYLLDLLPETRESGFFDLFVSVLENGKPVREETWFDSHAFKGWFDYAIVPIDKDIIVVTVQDITDQKNSMLEVERQKNMLDKIMQHSPSGITVTEVIRNKEGEIIDGKTILANAISGQFLGISHQQLLSKTSSEIDPNILDSPVFNQALHTLATGEPFITQYFLQPTGRWMELAVAKMDEDHLINVFTDVTEIRQSQLQMEKYVEELKRSNANLEEFAYAASHDLKEPVRKINFFGDRLKAKLKGKMDEEDLHYFNRMEFAAKRMTSLIDDLLVYSHVSRGAVLEERINLNKKVEMVLGDLELLVQEKNAVVDVGPLPIIIGHRRQIQQLFQNLISNALKYSKPDVPPRITIRSQDVRGQDVPIQLPGEDVSKRFHLIEVRDNGIGFEQDEAERIFKVFTRLHSSAEYRGTGIGLSIARRVVENHNGYIWAESQPGEGSVFRILLPVNAV